MTPKEIAAATDAIVGLLDDVDDLASRRRRDPAAEPVTLTTATTSLAAATDRRQ
jgi:hypothetical protein